MNYLFLFYGYSCSIFGRQKSWCNFCISFLLLVQFQCFNGGSQGYDFTEKCFISQGSLYSLAGLRRECKAKSIHFQKNLPSGIASEHTERTCNTVGNMRTSVKKQLKNNAVKCTIKTLKQFQAVPNGWPESRMKVCLVEGLVTMICNTQRFRLKAINYAWSVITL